MSTYVLDLLSEDQVGRTLQWASEALEIGGLLCLAGITPGRGLFSRLVMNAWNLLFSLNPAWVGGCRPVVLSVRLKPPTWAVELREEVVSWGVASEIVVARRGTAASS